MPVVACLGGVGRVQSGAVAWPMGLLGGNGRLVERGGGEWGRVAQQRPMASPQSLLPTGVRSGYAGD
jgi:hypothetical protein